MKFGIKWPLARSKDDRERPFPLQNWIVGVRVAIARHNQLAAFEPDWRRPVHLYSRL